MASVYLPKLLAALDSRRKIEFLAVRQLPSRKNRGSDQEHALAASVLTGKGRAANKGGDAMRTLVYKRTHIGDPDENGCFGIEDCMGRVRAYDFDSVIGVGGKSSQPRSQGIAEKLNWIGLGARKKAVKNRRAPVVTFEHFILYDDKGENIHDLAPVLAGHLLVKNARVVVNFTQAEQKEVNKILNMAKNARRSALVNRLLEIRNHGACGCGSRRRTNHRSKQEAARE